jgi:hypothetical protein
MGLIWGYVGFEIYVYSRYESFDTSFVLVNHVVKLVGEIDAFTGKSAIL